MEQDRSALPAPKDLRCSTCPQFGGCLFHLPKNGGFKDRENGKGHNVRYQIITDKTDGHHAKQDWMPCDIFVMTLQGRMTRGANRRNEGLDGERIRILGDDRVPGKVRQPVRVSLNSRNEVVKPLPELIEPLKEIGEKVNLDDLSESKLSKVVMLNVPVPTFAGRIRPGSSAAARELYELEREYEESEREAEEAAYSEAMARVAREAAGEIVTPKQKRAARAEPVEP